MLRLLILLLSLTYHVNSFSTCTGVAFCNQLRRRYADDETAYSADISDYIIKDNVVTIPLTNTKGTELDLQISILTERRARVKILQKDHSSYELTDVLAKDFPAASISRVDAEFIDSLSFAADYDRDFVVRVTGTTPVSVEFIYNKYVEVILNGSRLITNAEIPAYADAFSFAAQFEGARTLYGLFHHPVKLALSQTSDYSKDPFRFKNTNSVGSPVGSTQAMYGSVPVIYGHSPDRTSGIFLHNAAEQWVDITYNDTSASAHFMVISGTPDIFVMMGPTIKEVIRQYTDLTGTAHLPELWTLGYQQSRFAYETQEEVEDVVANMVSNDFPMDAIWLDVHYTDEKKYFTWDPTNFRDPEEMQRNLSSTNRKLVTIIEPHYKVDENYAIYTEAVDKKLLVTNPDGSINTGDCWPGRSAFFDFLNPAARKYYADLFSYDKFKKTTEVLAGIWLDMNEPSLWTEANERTLAYTALHIGGVAHRDVHNMYGFLHAMATHEGLLQRDGGSKRPFVISRSFFAGSQRYAAVWTGSTGADWSFLEITYSECINANLLGLVFCGADVGGQNGQTTDELLQRWYQAGIWLPFFREHTNVDSNRQEPYLYSENVQSVIRNAIVIRYKHIPVFYTLFYEHTRYGDPIIRPFFYDYPELVEQDDHVLVGSDILARPVMQQDASSVTVVFPGSDTLWYRVDDESWSVHKGSTSEEVNVDINTSPYYYRAGSVIPRKERWVSSTAEQKNDTLTLFANLDANENAEGRYYQDDYESFEYSTNNKYFYVNFIYVPATNSIRISLIDGNSEGLAPIIRGIIVHKTTQESKVYTTDANGIPLADIDIAAHFVKTRSNEFNIFL